MHKKFQIALVIAACLGSLVGCSSTTPQATAEQEKNFKGAPMPPDAAKQFAESQKQAAALAAKKAADAASGSHAPQ